LDRLLCDIVEITEDLTNQDSSAYALATLSKGHAPSSHEKAHGRVEEHEVEGTSRSGVYSKTC